MLRTFAPYPILARIERKNHEYRATTIDERARLPVGVPCAIAENDYKLAASRCEPHVTEEAPDEAPAAEAPAEWIRDVLAPERETTTGLEKQLSEVEQ